jgi:hypothetical protein
MFVHKSEAANMVTKNEDIILKLSHKICLQENTPHDNLALSIHCKGESTLNSKI